MLITLTPLTVQGRLHINNSSTQHTVHCIHDQLLHRACDEMEQSGSEVHLSGVKQSVGSQNLVEHIVGG